MYDIMALVYSVVKLAEHTIFSVLNSLLTEGLKSSVICHFVAGYSSLHFKGSWCFHNIKDCLCNDRRPRSSAALLRNSNDILLCVHLF